MIGLEQTTGTGSPKPGRGRTRPPPPTLSGPAESFASAPGPGGPIDQLPPVTRRLIGRELEVGRAKAWVGRHRRRDLPAPVVLIDGPPGSGRSALARSLAAELAAELPGPRLWVRLGTDGQHRRHPGEQLRGWLRDLGVRGAELPADPRAAAERFGDQLGGTGAVVVVEEAVSVDEVAWLRPPPGCVMVVTSRSPLPGVGLPAVRRFGLRPLGVLDALKLVSERAGWKRLAAEPGAARTILRCCEQLPLALTVAGAALGAAGGRMTVGEFARELADETQRRGDGLTAVLALADRSLAGRQAQALRAVGLLDLPVVDPEVLAAMLCLHRSEAADRLEELADAGLLDSDGRPYRVHDLVRSFARSLALEVGTEAQRRAVLRRAVAAYREKTDLAAGLLTAVVPAEDERGRASRSGARAWAVAEHGRLLTLVEAAVDASIGSRAAPPASGRDPLDHAAAGEPGLPLGGSGRGARRKRTALTGAAARDLDLPEAEGPGEGDADDGRRQLAVEAARLAAATDRVLMLLGATRDLERVRGLGLAAARRGAATRLEAWFAHRLGALHADEQEHEQATADLERAVALADRAGDDDLATLARFDLAYARCKAHQFEEARPLLEALLDGGVVDQELGDLARVNLGYVYRHLGRDGEARGLLEESLRSARRRHDARLAAFAERNLAKLAKAPDPAADRPVEPAPATGPMPIVQVPLAEAPPTTGSWPVHDLQAPPPAARADDHGGGPAPDPEPRPDRWPEAQPSGGEGPGVPLERLVALEEALELLSNEALAASSRGGDPSEQAVLRRLGAAVAEVGPVIGRLADALAALGPETAAAHGRWRRVRALRNVLTDLRPYVDRLGDAIAAATHPAVSPADLGALAAASEALRVRLDELRSAVRALGPVPPRPARGIDTGQTARQPEGEGPPARRDPGAQREPTGGVTGGTAGSGPRARVTGHP